MSIELGFLETRVARRLFLRFVMCAVLPISVLAALSYATVTANLRERGDLRLHEVATATERSVRDRLDRARDDLSLLAGFVALDPAEATPSVDAPAGESPDGALAASSRTSLDAVEHARLALSDLPRPAAFAALLVEGADGERESVYGDGTGPNSIDTDDIDHLESGKALVVEVPGDPVHIWMGRRVLGGSTQTPVTLWARMDRPHLWAQSAELAALPDVGGMCVLNSAFAALHGPAIAEAAFREEVETAVAGMGGSFSWDSSEEGSFLSVTRSIALADEYRSRDWHVVVNLPERAVMAPLRGFTFTFLPLVLLAFGTVLLFSVVQIRRTIRPLISLKDATRRISTEGFGARVQVSSNDEFQVLAQSFNDMASGLEQQFRTLEAMQQLDRVGLSATSRKEVVDALLQALLTVQQSEAVSVCTFQGLPGEETVSHSVVRAGPEVTVVHRFECAPWELAQFEENDHIVLDVHSREDLPCFLRVPPFNDLEHKRFLVVPVDPSELEAGLICFASTDPAAFGDEQVRRARHLTDQAALAFSNVNRMEELSHLNLGALRALARTIDASSPWTAGHSERVTRIAVALGHELQLEADDLDVLRRGGLLHDIGKIGVPVEILNKPSALTDDEFDRIKEHVTVGARILEPIAAYADLLPVVLYHHERMDGNGYPEGLVGEEIPFLARIMAVADTFDALTSDRPYRKGLPHRTAVEVVRNASGSQLDASVVAAFLRLVEEDSMDLDLMNQDPDTIDFVWDEPEHEGGVDEPPAQAPASDEEPSEELDPSKHAPAVAAAVGPRVVATL